MKYSILTKNNAISIVIMILVSVSYPVLCAGDEVTRPIISSEDATNRAIQFTGFSDFKSLSAKASSSLLSEQVISDDSSYEYARLYLKGKTIWQIKINDIYLHYASGPNDSGYSARKDFDIYLDSASGNLLAAVSIENAHDSVLSRLVDLKEASCPMTPLREKHMGMPLTLPKIPLYKALEICKAYPLVAKRITAIYVNYYADTSCSPRLKDTPMPVPAWIIYLEGLGPQALSYIPDPPTNKRYVINAETGRSMQGALSYSRPKKQ